MHEVHVLTLGRDRIFLPDGSTLLHANSSINGSSPFDNKNGFTVYQADADGDSTVNPAGSSVPCKLTSNSITNILPPVVKLATLKRDELGADPGQLGNMF